MLQAWEPEQLLADVFSAFQTQQQVTNYSLLTKEPPGFVREDDENQAAPPAPTTSERLLLVLLLVCSTVLLGVILPDLSVVFGLTGGFCGGLVTFCFPAMFYIRVASKKSERYLVESVTHACLSMHCVFFFLVCVCVCVCMLYRHTDVYIILYLIYIIYIILYIYN